MAPLTCTLAELTAAKLIAYYPPPPVGVPMVAPSTDPNVYLGDPNYLKQLNEQSFHKYAVDVPNANTAARFDFACKSWEMNGKHLPLPAPPSYSVFDEAAFDQWWAQFTANLGEPPQFYFIKPAPLPPPPVIVPEGSHPAAPAYDGPIGEAVPGNPGVFTPSAADTYPDGYIYAGPTGTYQKHIYRNPFTPGYVRIVWIALSGLACPAA